MSEDIIQNVEKDAEKVFHDVEHALAYIVNTLVPKAESIATKVEAVLGSDATEALLTLAGKGQYASLMAAIVGCIIKDLSTLGGASSAVLSAIEAHGLNIQLDEVAIAALKTIYMDIKDVFDKNKTVVAVQARLN